MKRRPVLVAVLVTLLLGFSTVAAFADGTETLGPPSIDIAAGSGIAAGGTGLWTQPGSISVSVPADATVQQVLLYWEGLFDLRVATRGDDTLVVGGHNVTGTSIGGPTGVVSLLVTETFRADITDLGLVGPGANTVSVSGMNNSFANNGAGILVIYQQPGKSADNSVRDGSDYAFVNFAAPKDTTVPQTFTFPAEAVGRTARLVIFTSSVEPNRPNALVLVTAGQTTTLVNPLGDGDGREWDTLVLPVDIPAGADTVTVQLLSQSDGTDNLPASMVWNAASLSVPRTPPANPALTLVKKTNGTDNNEAPGPTVPVGSVVTWTYDVTNTGDVTLTGIAVTDDRLPDSAIDCNGGSNVIPTLAVGATATCTATGTAQVGQYRNVGTASTTYDGTPVSATDPDHHFGEQVARAGETATGAGTRWPGTANWFMYTKYTTATVDLIAGQHHDAGDIRMVKVNSTWTDITFTLHPGWAFAGVGENLKIHDMAKAPKDYVPPGAFNNKFTVSGNPVTVRVPTAGFYGIHADVERLP